MISSKFLATTAVAAAVISTLGLAYAQTTVPTPDSARVEPNKATMQPGTNGTTVTTQGTTGTTGATGSSTTTGTTAPMGSTMTTPSTTMPADAPMRDQNGKLRSDSTNNNMNRNMSNSSSDMSSGRSTARTERVARADRN